jgi:hypothetical protein
MDIPMPGDTGLARGVFGSDINEKRRIVHMLAASHRSRAY